MGKRCLAESPQLEVRLVAEVDDARAAARAAVATIVQMQQTDAIEPGAASERKLA